MGNNQKNTLENHLNQGSLAMGINLQLDAISIFMKYLKIMRDYQDKINIIATKDEQEIIDKHLLDSISTIPIIKSLLRDVNRKIKMIDIGSGAGLPGIPVKIILPNTEMILLEARENKRKFLQKTILDLNLKNINTIQDRAENLGKNWDFREKYQFVLSRAVAPLVILSEYTLPLCKVGGYVLAYKGSSYQDELNKGARAIHSLGGLLEKISFIKIPNTPYLRSIIIIKKISPTPEQYPRRNGIPGKRPLYF